MNYILLCSLILSAFSALFSSVRQYQMLQQSSYFPSRYAAWVKNSFAVWLAVLSILFCFSSLLFSAQLYIAQAILIGMVLVFRVFQAIKIQKTAIKKLVFTGRIKRMLSAQLICFAALILVYCLFQSSVIGESLTVIIFMLSFITPISVLLSWCVTLPIEKAFSRYYINDAKKILKSMPSLRVIGITGSYGKTTTKFILNRILSEKFEVTATPKSYNTTFGVVRTVRENLLPTTQILICEMGAKNKGDIKEICDIVNPDFGIISSVGPQHLETFKTVDNVFETKFELAKAVHKKGGAVFVNGDSAEIKSRIKNEDYRIYGTDSSYKYYAENIKYSRNGSSFDLILDGEQIRVETRLLGKHSVINIIAASALAFTLGLSAEEIKFAIGALKPTEHRLELKSFHNGSLVIDDAYNANPEGCLEAVRILGEFEGMRKVIVTPGLIELGSREYDCNFALGLEAAKYCDVIILVGQNRSKPLREGVLSGDFDQKNLHIVSSFKEAMDIYISFADENTVVLLENDLPDNYLN